MKTVLVVDDSQTIRTAVRWTLRGTDFEVLVSPDASNARRVMAERTPDLILLDVGLGEVSGFDVCAELKRTPATAHIPVLLMPSAFEGWDASRAEGAQADGHVEKPFDTQTLIDAVRTQVGLPLDESAPVTYAGRLARQRAAANPPPSPSERPPPVPVDAPPPPAPPRPEPLPPAPPAPPAPPRPEPSSPSGSSPFAAPALEGESASSFEVTIDETEPVELDADELEEVAEGVEYDRSEDEDGVTPPAGPSLEPPPAPGPPQPPVDVDVWALADEGDARDRPPPPRMPPELPPRPASPAPEPAPQAAPEPEGAPASALDSASAAVADAVGARPPLDALPREELRAIAREVIESIAWEVVPDLAETIIKEELARLTK